MVIAVLGGGASGLMAAIAASKHPGCEVHILERQNRVGRKLLATGNGRCNLTNTGLSVQAYHGERPEFVLPSLQRFGLKETLAFFQNLGLLTVADESGRVYPWSDQAGSVVDVLRFALETPNVHLHTGAEVTKICRQPEGGFLLTCEDGSLSASRVIAACGGLAGTALGGSMAGYRLLKSLGHHCTKLRPALVQLKSSYPRCASLKGIRAVCRLWLTQNGETTVENRGEVQFRLWPQRPRHLRAFPGRLHRTRRLGLPPGSAAQPDRGRPQGFPHPAQAAVPRASGGKSPHRHRTQPAGPHFSPGGPDPPDRVPSPSPVPWAWTAPRSPPGDSAPRNLTPLHWKAACAPGYTPAASFWT